MRRRSLWLGSVWIALSVISCKNHEPKNSPQLQRDPSVVVNETQLDAKHQQSLLEDAQSAIKQPLLQSFNEIAPSALSAKTGLIQILVSALSRATSATMIDAKSHNCDIDGLHLNPKPWLNCVITHPIQAAFSSDATLQKSLRDEAKILNATLPGDFTNDLDGIQLALLQPRFVSRTVEILSEKMSELGLVLSILRNGNARSELPWIAASFFTAQRFLMTNSFQQGSVGSFRGFNFDSLIVYFEVKGDHLFILRDKKGAYDGENGENMILGSYPIAAARKTGAETYYQVDFSAPVNKRFLLPYIFGFDAGPEIDLTAEAIFLHLAHPLKTVKTELGSGIYFNANDSNLVLDELVLVNGTASLDTDEPFASPGALTPSFLLKKESLRPTLRIMQGFVKLDATAEDFAQKQAKDLSLAAADLFTLGVGDLTSSSDIPYFPSGFNINPGKKIEPSSRAHAVRMNTARDIVFVISGNTPDVAVPVIKSAVNSYRDLFNRLKSATENPVTISVLTQAEFEQTEAGKSLGGAAIAADPRVNMIQWEDVPGFSAAWATTASNPESGESLSGDVVLPGTLWAKAGCIEYMIRSWAAKPRPGETPTPFPHPVSYALYDLSCNLRLLGMKLVGTGSLGTVDVVDDVPVQRILEATRAGDAAAMEQIFYEVIKQQKNQVAEQAGNVPRASGESDIDYAERVSARYTQLLHDTEIRLPASFRTPDHLVPEDVLKPNPLHSTRSSAGLMQKTQLQFHSGKSHINILPTCSRSAADIHRNLFLANAGMPGLNPELIKDSKEAALAMLRIVTIHELGHLFGLKHNFSGSTAPSELETPDRVPVKPSPRTDSIMDYNDAGIELEMGAMIDYADPNSAANTPSFGVYDILALGNLYGLDLSTYKLKNRTAFCSDGSKDLFSNCLPFDYGSDSLEYQIYQLNLSFQELRGVKDTDLGNPFVIADLNRRLDFLASGIRFSLNEMIHVWGYLTHLAANSNQVEEQARYISTIDKVFYGRGLSGELFGPRFKAKTGMDHIGIDAAMKMTGIQVALDPAKKGLFADITADNLRRYVDLELLSALDDVDGFAATLSADSLFIKGLPDVRGISAGQSKAYQFRTNLTEFYARKILLPAGTPISHWSYLDGIAKKAGGSAIAFDTPFFNSRRSIRVKQNVMIPTGSNAEKPVLAIAEGDSSLNEMILASLALAKIGPWGGPSGGSLSFERLLQDKDQLAALIQAGQVSAAATDHAKFMMSTYDWTSKNGFSPF